MKLSFGKVIIPEGRSQETDFASIRVLFIREKKLGTENWFFTKYKGGDMHDCSNCGQVCDCDGEDFFYDNPPPDCSHECDEEEEDT